MDQTSPALATGAGRALVVYSAAPVTLPGTVSAMTDERSSRKSASARNSVGLPSRLFLYTIDQVANMMSVSENYVHHEYAHYDGRSIGIPSPDRLVFRNIAPKGARPVWRCSEAELIRFLRHKGYMYYEKGFIH